MIALASMDLPLPDSPTIPTVSPCPTLRSTPERYRRRPARMPAVVLDPQVANLEQGAYIAHYRRSVATARRS